MEDSGTESNESINSSDGITVSGGTPAQDADAKFGDYSRDWESTEADRLVQADGLSTDISGADQEISMCAWFNTEADPANMTIGGKYNHSTSNHQYSLGYSGAENIMRFGVSADGANDSNADGVTDVSSGWHHVCGVYNDIDVRLYIDGSLDSNGASNPKAHTTGIYNGNYQFIMGALYWTATVNHWDGLIDDVGIFDIALSSTDINDIMDNGLIQVSAHRIPTTLELRNVTVW